MVPLRIDIWSDIACPWCYIGKRRFERALERFPDAEAVKVTWRAFELDPAASREKHEGKYAERLAKKYGTSAQEAQAMIDRLVGAAKAEGLDFDFDRIRPGNTFDAHRLLHWALEQGLQSLLKERLLRAYFCEGQPIGDRETLLRLAVDVGLDGESGRSILDNESYAREVRQDEDEARALGITGVPFFVLAEQFGVSGAQPPEILMGVLEKARRATPAPSSQYALRA